MGQLWARPDKSALVTAVRSGRVEEVGSRLRLLACTQVERLLKTGSQPREGEEPILCVAARLGFTLCVEVLLGHGKVTRGQGRG